MQKHLLDILLDLEHVEQNPTYHPEGNALYHSLQVFELSLKLSRDPIIWTAALFHDVGKAIDGPSHAEIGADMLSGIFNENVCWLVKHHLDLLTHPAQTTRKLQNTSRLSQLRLLRQLDLAGRDPYCEVCSPEFAVHVIGQNFVKVK